MAYDFTLPDFLQDCDADTIHAKMLEELPADIDKTEGGFPWDFTRPTALIAAELLEFYIPEAIKLMFPQWSTGTYLDYLANMAGTERKTASYATVTLMITGTPYTEIPAGTVFATAATNGAESVEFQSLDDCTISSEGYCTVIVQAVIAGTNGNVGADTITLMSSPITGVTGVTNESAATGGTEEESDDDLRERILDANSSGDMSYIGNTADYKRWAEEVDGIGSATVVEAWDGEGTVKIVCLDANGDAASETLLQAVYDYIMSPDDPEKRLAPLNVVLTVAAPELVEISYAFTAELEAGYELESVVEAFEAALDEYYQTVSDSNEVKYIKVYALLANTEGIDDFSALTINGGTDNIAIDADQYPKTAAIEGTEAEVTSDGS